MKKLSEVKLMTPLTRYRKVQFEENDNLKIVKINLRDDFLKIKNLYNKLNQLYRYVVTNGREDIGLKTETDRKIIEYLTLDFNQRLGSHIITKLGNEHGFDITNNKISEIVSEQLRIKWKIFDTKIEYYDLPLVEYMSNTFDVIKYQSQGINDDRDSLSNILLYLVHDYFDMNIPKYLYKKDIHKITIQMKDSYFKVNISYANDNHVKNHNTRLINLNNNRKNYKSLDSTVIEIPLTEQMIELSNESVRFYNILNNYVKEKISLDNNLPTSKIPDKTYINHVYTKLFNVVDGAKVYLKKERELRNRELLRVQAYIDRSQGKDLMSDTEIAYYYEYYDSIPHHSRKYKDYLLESALEKKEYLKNSPIEYPLYNKFDYDIINRLNTEMKKYILSPYFVGKILDEYKIHLPERFAKSVEYFLKMDWYYHILKEGHIFTYIPERTKPLNMYFVRSIFDKFSLRRNYLGHHSFRVGLPLDKNGKQIKGRDFKSCIMRVNDKTCRLLIFYETDTKREIGMLPKEYFEKYHK